MKAAILYAVGERLVVDDVDLDPPKEGEVLVRLAASGICGSDLHVMDGSAPHPLPVLLGHEGAGIVEALGDGVTSLQPGDHVIICLAPACGRCFYCARGKPNLCEGMPYRGQGTLLDGTGRVHVRGRDVHHYTHASTFAECTVVSERACIKIRDDAPLDRVCLIGCGVTTGVGAVLNTAKVETGSSVAIFGCGGVGLNAVQGATLAGADPIIAIDVRANKLEWARRFGATHLINGAKEDPVAAVKRMTGRGADYAFEVIGIPSVLEQAFASIRPGGTCTMVGSPPAGSSMTVDMRFLILDRRLLGCAYGSARPRVDIPMLVDLYMNGRLRLDELVTRTTDLVSINEAIDAVKAGEVARTVLVN